MTSMIYNIANFDHKNYILGGARRFHNIKILGIYTLRNINNCL